MPTDLVLDPLVQQQLREQPHVADPEPPRCAEPDHGNPSTNAATCEACRLYRNWREREYQRRAKAGKANRFTDIHRLREHIKALENAAMVIPDIARTSGVHEKVLQTIRYGNPKWVTPLNAERLLAVPVPAERRELVRNSLGHLRRRVDATGTHRRMRCGQGNGYNLNWQAERLGWERHILDFWLTTPTVDVDVADAVATLYPQMLEKPGPCRISRGIAAKKGWPQARHFSDTNIDDPTYDPFRIVKTPYRVYRRLRSMAYIGQGPAQVGIRIGESAETVRAWMEGGPAPAYAYHLVAADYERWSFTEGPDIEAADRARHMDWPSPLAWEDVPMDKSWAQPRYNAPVNLPLKSLTLNSVVYDAIDGRVKVADLTHDEMEQAVDVLHRRGWSDRRIAEWLHWNEDGDLDKGRQAVCKARERANIRGFGIAIIGNPGYDAQNDLIVAPSAA